MGIVTQSQLKCFFFFFGFWCFCYFYFSNKEKIFGGYMAVNNLPQNVRKLPWCKNSENYCYYCFFTQLSRAYDCCNGLIPQIFFFLKETVNRGLNVLLLKCPVMFSILGLNRFVSTLHSAGLQSTETCGYSFLSMNQAVLSNEYLLFFETIICRPW